MESAENLKPFHASGYYCYFAAYLKRTGISQSKQKDKVPKAFTKFEKVKSEGSNEKLGQVEEKRDSRSDDNNGSKHYKYQCLSEQPLLVLKEFTEGVQIKYFNCD